MSSYRTQALHFHFHMISKLKQKSELSCIWSIPKSWALGELVKLTRKLIRSILHHPSLTNRFPDFSHPTTVTQSPKNDKFPHAKSRRSKVNSWIAFYQDQELIDFQTSSREKGELSNPKTSILKDAFIFLQFLITLQYVCILYPWISRKIGSLNLRIRKSAKSIL